MTKIMLILIHNKVQVKINQIFLFNRLLPKWLNPIYIAIFLNTGVSLIFMSMTGKVSKELRIHRARRKYIKDPPTSLTFYYFFKTIRKFMESSPARWKLTVTAFESCCQHGCLNEIVLDLVIQNLIPSPEQGRALLKEYWSDTNDTSAVLIADLPKEWTRRAMRNRRKRREPSAQ